MLYKVRNRGPAGLELIIGGEKPRKYVNRHVMWQNRQGPEKQLYSVA